MYCVYHGEDHPEPTSLGAKEFERHLRQGTLFSDEHIFPYSIGGSDDFTISVCASSNNHFGTAVDGAVVNHPFISIERVLKDLRAKDGKPPSVTWRGVDQETGKEMTYEFSPERKSLRSIPQVIWSTSGDNVILSADKDVAPKILQNINRKLRRDGKQMPEIADILEGATEVRSTPTINTTLSFDVHAMDRFFAKAALATGHRYLGEAFSKSPAADLLRQFLWEENRDKRAAIPIRGCTWPTESTLFQILIERIQSGTMHVAAMLRNNADIIFFATLFGKYSAHLILTDDQNLVAGFGEGSGIAWIIDPLTRTGVMRTFSVE